MKAVSTQTTRAELAAIVVEHLEKKGLSAVLVGGSLVSIYTNNKYESHDLDFISSGSQQQLKAAMKELGFVSQGKDFIHPKTHFSVEFPTGPLAIGDDEPIEAEGELSVDGIKIKVLSPTQCVMDRLAWFFYSNDRQCLDQAVWIYHEHPVNLNKVKEWVLRESQEEKFEVFLNYLHKG